MCSCIAAFLYVVLPALALLCAPYVLSAYDASVATYKALGEALSATNHPVAWRFSCRLVTVAHTCNAAVTHPTVYRWISAISVALCVALPMAPLFASTGPPIATRAVLDGAETPCRPVRAQSTL